MNDKLTNIVEQLKSLTLLEAAELVKEIETVFGVDTSISVGSVGMAMPQAAAAPAEAAEKNPDTPPFAPINPSEIDLNNLSFISDWILSNPNIFDNPLGTIPNNESTGAIIESRKASALSLTA
jgi:hypothetical protein